jgi:hypothetical protein
MTIEEGCGQRVSICQTIVDGSVFTTALNVTMPLFLVIFHSLAAKIHTYRLTAKNLDSLVRSITLPCGHNAKPN